jgi:nitrate reductase gamma subunit
MLCHDATPTVSVALSGDTGVRTDWLSIIGLLIFAAGMLSNFSLYLKGKLPGRPEANTAQKIAYLASRALGPLFSRRVLSWVGTAVTEGVFLRRTWRRGKGRWAVHALIFLPLLARLILGIATWLGMVIWPAADWVQTLANKDALVTAFFYDLMTALTLLGVLLALVRRFIIHDRRLPTFAQDRIALGILGAIILVGILTEGIRLLSAGTPPTLAIHSFLGYGTAMILRPLDLAWTSIYPAIWYIHALLAVALIAYFPFSKFMHILVTPLITSSDAARKRRD